MPSVHVPAIAPGEPAPCHPHRALSGGPARCWCRGCGATYQARPAEIVTTEPRSPAGDVLAREARVARAAAARAHELELERATHVPEYRP